MKKIYLGFASLSFALLAAASGEAFAKKKVKEGIKSGDTKDSSLANKSNAETNKETSVIVSAPFVRPGQAISLNSSAKVADDLKNLDKVDILNGDRPAPVAKGGKTPVDKTVASTERKKTVNPFLHFGEFRTSNVTAGNVLAPQIPDYVSYYRYTTALSKFDGPKIPLAGAKTGTTEQAVSAKTGEEPAFTRLGGFTPKALAAQTENEKLRLETVESIKQLLLTRPPDAQRFDLLMRLSEIQAERHAHALELEIRDFNDAHSKWVSDPKLGSEPIFKNDRSNAQLLIGIDALRGLVTQFPSHKRTPEALMSLGLFLTQMQSENATLYFDRLISRFPKSELVPAAQLATAETYFAHNQFDKALVNYQKVLTYKGTPEYAYAVYKLGWTYFNMRTVVADSQKNLSKSLAAFKLVVKLSDDVNASKAVKELRKEALKDLILVFSESGDIASAQKFFEGAGDGGLYFNVLERLAWMKTEQGKFAEATQFYQRLIAEGSALPRLPVYYSRLCEIYERQNNRVEIIKTLTTMSVSLANDGAWMRNNQKNTEAIDIRNKTLAKEMRGWSEKFHIEAQKTNSEKTYDDALSSYTVYLNNFGDRPESYSAHFFRAEILAHKGKYLEAAENYIQAAKLDEKNATRGKFTRDAILNTIAALDLSLSKAPAIKLPETGHASQKLPLAPLNAKLLDAIDMYVRLFPTQTDTLEFAHRAAMIQYAFGDYADATARWTKLAPKYPASKEIFEGLRLSVKVSVDRDLWKDVIGESRRFLEIPGIKETKTGQEITKILRGAVFQRGLALEKTDNRAEAAEMFMAYHKEFQATADAPKALFNVANNKYRLGRTDEAITSLKTLIAQYPQSDLVANAHYYIGNSYDTLGQFSESASAYEQLANDFPKSPVAAEVLARATAERVSLGENDQGLKNANRFVSFFPRHKDVGEVWMWAGKAYLKLGNAHEAAKAFGLGAESVERSNANMSIYLKGLAAEAHLRDANANMVSKTSLSGLTVAQSVPVKSRDSHWSDGVRMMSMAQLAALDTQLPEIMKRHITDGTKVTEQFTKIRDEVQSLAQKYAVVAKSGNAEAGTGALYRVAELQEFLAGILLKSPIPNGVKPTEIEQFKGTLEKVALPLQEEAANLYMTAWQKAVESEAITPFTRKLFDKLVVLRPSDFRKSIEEMMSPQYFESSVVLTNETKGIVKN